MNPKDPLWYLPTRPRVANLIDELPNSFSDHAATQQVRGYLRRLSEHGIDVHPEALKGSGSFSLPVVALTTPALKMLLRAVYLDGRRDEEEDAKLRPAPDDVFDVEDRGVNFVVHGLAAWLATEPEGESAEDFDLWVACQQRNDLHTLTDVAAAYPRVAVSQEAWYAGRHIDFSVLLATARAASVENSDD